MTTKYLRSQTTGVVLPFNEKLLKRSNVELMTPAECAAYEAKEKIRVAAIATPHPDVVIPTVTAQPEPPPPPPPPQIPDSEPEPEPELELEAVLDVSDEEMDADALLASLEDD